MTYGGMLIYKPKERQERNNYHPQEGLNKRWGQGRQFNAFLSPQRKHLRSAQSVAGRVLSKHFSAVKGDTWRDPSL